MQTRLRRPAVALITTTLAASVLGFVPAAHAADGTVTGTLTNADGAIVFGQATLYRYVGDASFGYWAQTNYHDFTDQAGVYDIVAPAGDYRVRFAGGDDDAFEFYGDADFVEDGDSVTVPSSGSVTANAELEPAAHLAGSVEGPDGTLLDDMVVNAYMVLADGEQRWAGWSSTTDGAYDIGGLPGGTYVVEFDESFDGTSDFAVEYYEDQPNRWVADTVTVADGATRPEVDAQLELDSEISGQVTAGEGGTLDYATVTAMAEVDGRWRPVAYAEAESDGSYVIDGLAADTYRVLLGGEIAGRYVEEYWENTGDVDEATDVVLGADDSESGIDAVLIEGEHWENLPQVENVTPVTISGTPQVGSPLTSSAGTWSPTPELVEYYFVAGEELLQAGTSPTYVPKASDLGKTISVYVYASAEGYDYGFSIASASGPVVAAPAPAPAPAPTTAPAPVVDVPAGLAAVLDGVDVKGKPKVGKTVKVTGLDKLFRASTAVSYSFKWFAGKKAIKKATKSKLKITQAMKGKKISVKVTAKAADTRKSTKIKVGKVR